MVPSELMFNFLKQQGFCPEVEEYGIAFKYQMKNFIFWKNDDDSGFFQLILPGIFDVNEENINTVLHAANRVNCDLKVAKANVMNGEIKCPKWNCVKERHQFWESNFQQEDYMKN